MEIALINGWSDDNKGDAAIVQGLVRLLREAHQRRGAAEPLHFTIVSSFPGGDADLLAYHYRQTAPPGSGIEVCGSPLPTVYLRAKGAVARRLGRLGELGRAAVLLSLAPLYRRAGKRWGLGRETKRTVQALQEADVVISKGGHIYFASGSLLSWVGLFYVVFPLLLAQALGKPTVIYAQSIGPVRGRLPRALLRRCLLRSRVMVREILSYEAVVDLLGPEYAGQCCQVVWDTAFAVGREPLPEPVAAQLPSRFVVMTIRQWNFPYDHPSEQQAKYDHYLQAMADLIRRVNREWGLPVVLAPQVIGPTPDEVDWTAADQLRPYLHDAEYVEVREDLSAAQLGGLYERAELMIGTRFHSVILALAAGTPSLAISYHGFKATGIMKMLGLEGLVFEIDGLDVDLLWSALRDLWERREAHRAWLVEKNALIHSESAATATSVLEASRP